MAKRDDTLIEQIERDALDDKVPVATALRKCIVLGGKSGSENLRDWATRELQGYHGVEQDRLPDYRIIAAPLMMDAVKVNAQITGQQFSPSVLPEGVRDHIKEEVPLREGVGQIEALLKQSQIKLSPSGASDIVRLMNHEVGDPSQQIVSIYWSVAHSAVEGALDQVRTSLTQLVAELRANMPAGDELPSPEAANNAVTLVMTGKRARANITSAQASGGGTTSTATSQPQQEDSGFWTRSRRVIATVAGVAGVVSAVIAVITFL